MSYSQIFKSWCRSFYEKNVDIFSRNNEFYERQQDNDGFCNDGRTIMAMKNNGEPSGLLESNEKDPIVSSHCRQAYTQLDFQDKYNYTRPQQKSIVELGKYIAQQCCCCDDNSIMDNAWTFTKRHLPLLEWLPHYSPRRNILSDIISGLTVGVMHIPQGMAYAMLGNVPPVLGLYVSLFPVLVYFFMGTSRHISIGTFAVVCLMLSKSVDKLAVPYSPTMDTLNSTNEIFLKETPSDLQETIHYSPVEVATVVCLMVGIIQILMGLLRFGSLSVYLSDTLISGFTTGAAVHVFTSQVKNLFGVTIGKYNGPLKIIYIYLDIASVIRESNHVAVIISTGTIVILLLMNEFLNPLIKSKFKFTLPLELLTIVFGMFLSSTLELNSRFAVDVVGYIPTGLPSPQLPPIGLLGAVAYDSIAISVVGFTIALSMAKLFANKHNYNIDANQELLSLGTANIASSFFSCFPCSASLSRSLIQEGSGGRTQMASIVSSGFLLAVILYAGPLFETLPNCVLSSIIVVALLGMFRQVRDLKSLWKISIIESTVWLVTFFGVVLTEVDIGLAIGVVASIASVIARSHKPYTCLLGKIEESNVYMDISKYKSAMEESDVKIFRFCSPLYFANREFFRHELYRLVQINPQNQIINQSNKQMGSNNRRRGLEKLKRKASNASSLNVDLENSAVDDVNSLTASLKGNLDKIQESSEIERNPELSTEITFDVDVHHIIIDCSFWSFIDSAGITTLIHTINDFGMIGIKVHLTMCSDMVMETLEKHPCFIESLENHIYPTIDDAKAVAQLGWSSTDR